MRLAHSIELDAARVLEMAGLVPTLSRGLAAPLARLRAGDPWRSGSGPFMLEAIGWILPSSIARLRLLDEAVEHFDARGVPGWDRTRAAFFRAQRREWVSRYSECTIAYALDRRGLKVVEFEPGGAPGKQADLAIETAGERTLVEIIAPQDGDGDFQTRATQLLVERLKRTDFGLELSVRGYQQDSAPPVGNELDRVAARVRRAAERLPKDAPLPASLFDEGILVTATARISTGTRVLYDWHGAVAGKPARLADLMLAERKHFLPNQPAILLVDIANQSAVFDVRDRELDIAAQRVAKRSNPPVYLGAVRSPIDAASLADPERRALFVNSVWGASPAGVAVRAAW